MKPTTFRVEVEIRRNNIFAVASTAAGMEKRDEKLLLAIVGLIALGVALPHLLQICPSRQRRHRLWPRFTIGPVFTSAVMLAILGGHWDGDLTFDPGTGPLVGVFDPSHRTIDANGWLAGGQIGFNYQVNSFVFGLEADASWTNLKGNGSFNTIPGDFNWAIENQLELVRNRSRPRGFCRQ